jgi:hypothetical protein
MFEWCCFESHVTNQSLNSSAIRARSRIEAEKFYLLEICKSLPSSAISSATTAIAAVNSELHPRFSELVSLHGLPIAASDASSVTLAASLAEVACADRSSSHRFSSRSTLQSGHSALQRAISGQESQSPPALCLFDDVSIGSSFLSPSDIFSIPVASQHERRQVANFIGRIIQSASRFPLPPSTPTRVMLHLCALISSAGSLQLVLVRGGDESVLDDDLKELAYFGFCSGCTLQITRT